MGQGGFLVPADPKKVTTNRMGTQSDEICTHFHSRCILEFVFKENTCQLKMKSVHGNNRDETCVMGNGGKPVGTPEK